jgi:hypothetical protein
MSNTNKKCLYQIKQNTKNKINHYNVSSLNNNHKKLTEPIKDIYSKVTNRKEKLLSKNISGDIDEVPKKRMSSNSRDTFALITNNYLSNPQHNYKTESTKNTSKGIKMQSSVYQTYKLNSNLFNNKSTHLIKFKKGNFNLPTGNEKNLNNLNVRSGDLFSGTKNGAIDFISSDKQTRLDFKHSMEEGNKYNSKNSKEINIKNEKLKAYFKGLLSKSKLSHNKNLSSNHYSSVKNYFKYNLNDIIRNDNKSLTFKESIDILKKESSKIRIKVDKAHSRKSINSSMLRGISCLK